MLDEKAVKATFFCLGKNVVSHPDIHNDILTSGHAVGSHGYDHLNVWETDYTLYIENIYKTKEIISGNLFRPPYGKITRKFLKYITNEYRLVLWSLLSFDYEKNITAAECLEHLKKRTRPGDIVVFHDSKKVPFNIVPLIEEYIDFCRNKGWSFDKIR